MQRALVHRGRVLIWQFLALILLACSTQKSHPANWETVVDHAQQAAWKIDAEAVPVSLIIARNPPDFFYEWIFIQPATEELIRVKFDQRDISHTIETDILAPEAADYYLVSLPDKDEHERLRQLPSLVHITPEEAIKQANFSDLLTENQYVYDGIHLRFNSNVEEKHDTLVLWVVRYTGPSWETLYIYVDATTGEVVKQRTLPVNL